MKKFYCLLLLSILVFSCKPVKKVQTLNNAISKKDTVQTVIIKEAPKVDTLALINDMLDKVNKRKIDFTTFNAKIKVDYQGQETSQGATAYVKMKKDSIILIQVVGPLGIVGLQAKITIDSVIVVNKIDKYVQRRSISYINEVTQIPFDFYTLQDLLIGNPIFVTTNVVSYKPSNDHLLVLMIGTFFKNLLTLDNTDYKLLHSKMDDVDIQRNRTCDITYSNYEAKGNLQFATYRSVSVAEKYKLDINLDFKQYSFNEPLNYTFNIPKNYKAR
ncbi:DUF4292 domain-containing protein [Parasediminibacterium sp. JCM 36343]|uniref:DUF4292 domain-containing protein n=1 Tax=Parasediminibacterium sp. JCM 36343 TaxID=3374279 RepID=UPI00397D8785